MVRLRSGKSGRCSRPETKTEPTRMRLEYKFSGKSIIDPENILVKYFNERDLLGVATSEKKGYERTATTQHLPPCGAVW
jgi:hypothetical protein